MFTEPGLSIINAKAALAAIRPSVNDPDENLCDEAPDASPAANKPLTVVILS